MWLAYNPAEKAKRRKHFVTIFGNDGRLKLRTEPVLPSLDNDYEIAQTGLDDKGNAYFLLLPVVTKGSPEDTLKRPVLARLDVGTRVVTEVKLPFLGHTVHHANMVISSEEKLFVLAATTVGGAKGFPNGDKSTGAARTWTSFEVMRFGIGREIETQVHEISNVADSLTKRYTEPANFSESRVKLEGDQLLWILEEAFAENKAIGKQFFRKDLAVLSFNASNGKLVWQTYIDKNQSDMNGESMLSYTWGGTEQFLHFVYLDKLGAGGKILMQSVNRETGGVLERELMSNESGNFMFYPRRSAMVGNYFRLIGVGNPTQNNYYLITISQLP
jgi:hypothetical protein